MKSLSQDCRKEDILFLASVCIRNSCHPELIKDFIDENCKKIKEKDAEPIDSGIKEKQVDSEIKLEEKKEDENEEGFSFSFSFFLRLFHFFFFFFFFLQSLILKTYPKSGHLPIQFTILSKPSKTFQKVQVCENKK